MEANKALEAVSNRIIPRNVGRCTTLSIETFSGNAVVEKSVSGHTGFRAQTTAEQAAPTTEIDSPTLTKKVLAEYLSGKKLVDFGSAFGIAAVEVSDLPAELSVFTTRRRPGYDFAKRAIDITGAAFLLLLLFPVALIIAIAIKVTSPGPVLFKQKRGGLNGRDFSFLKFRSMVINAEEVLKQHPELHQEYLKAFKLKKDPRITKVGTFLRKTSLDELPQLINILVGDMSLIGPRPLTREQRETYGVFGNKFVSVMPGLSGLWQACGRSDASYPDQVLMDMVYVDQSSLMLDIRLALMTIVSVVKGHGAY